MNYIAKTLRHAYCSLRSHDQMANHLNHLFASPVVHNEWLFLGILKPSADGESAPQERNFHRKG